MKYCIFTQSRGNHSDCSFLDSLSSLASPVVFNIDAEPKQFAQVLECDLIEESELWPAGHLFVAGL